MEATQAPKAARSTAKSDVSHKAAEMLMPFGVAPAYASWRQPHLRFTQPHALPLIAKAKGATLTDLDGNHYLDFVCAHGAEILGHADERIVAAISKAASKGCAFGAGCEVDLRLAELIASRCPAIDMVHFTNTSKDALTVAIATARSFTKKRRIVVCAGYAPGVAFRADCADEVLTVAYNDAEALERLLERESDDIAAVLIEPVGVSGGLVRPKSGFLGAIHGACDKHGVLLIFDETASAFRVAPGGAVALFDVQPDLVMMGPIIGGGLSLAACGGRREVMLAATANPAAIQPATSSHVVAMAAGLATLQALGEPEVYQTLETAAARLDEGLRAAAAAVAELSTQHTRVASMLGLFFAGEPAAKNENAADVNADTYFRFHRAMLDRGVYLPSLPLSPWFLTAAHSVENIDRAIEAAQDSLKAITVAGNG